MQETKNKKTLPKQKQCVCVAERGREKNLIKPKKSLTTKIAVLEKRPASQPLLLSDTLCLSTPYNGIYYFFVSQLIHGNLLFFIFMVCCCFFFSLFLCLFHFYQYQLGLMFASSRICQI